MEIDKHEGDGYTESQREVTDMDENEVIEMLEKKREYHIKQIAVIDQAIETMKAIEGTSAETAPKHTKSKRLPWTQHVKEVLSADKAISFTELRKALAAKGVEDADTPTNYPSVYAAVNNLVKRGIAKKDKEGKYKLAKK